MLKVVLSLAHSQRASDWTGYKEFENLLSERLKPQVSTEKIIPKSPSSIKTPEIVISQPLSNRSVVSSHRKWS